MLFYSHTNKGKALSRTGCHGNFHKKRAGTGESRVVPKVYEK
jgi:hypothetical protein